MSNKFSSNLSQRRLNLISEIARQGRMVQDVAQAAGIAPSTMSKLLYGHGGKPSPALKQKIAAILGRSERWLFKVGVQNGRKIKGGDPNAHPSNADSGTPACPETGGTVVKS